MNKKALLKKIKSFEVYELFRKVRFLFNVKPDYNKVKIFVLHYFGGLYKRIDTHHVFLFAGGLAFSLFVCIVPFTLIIFWILGNFLDSAEVELQLNSLIHTVIPYETYSNFVQDIIFKRIYEVIEYKNIAGVVGFTGLFFAASGFFSSVRTILNKVYGTDEDVSLVLGKIRDFALIILALVVLLVSTFIIPALDILRNLSQTIPLFHFFQLGIFQKIFTTLFSLTILYFIFSVMYSVVPTVKIKKRAVLVGAMWAALLWETAKQAFGYYLFNLASWGKIYGTYTLVVVVAFWIYYSSIVFIIGAEIGMLYHERLIGKLSLDEKL
ncbi:MAG: YihY/virulence factor BrkB family protein [Ignavibacteriales bacterium]|nr:YihY/virulence factor BrkB family protein [Ignavibacteriales bacterium]